MLTAQDRRKELDVLLAQMRDNPSRDWSETRERVRVLTQMLAEKPPVTH